MGTGIAAAIESLLPPSVGDNDNDGPVDGDGGTAETGIVDVIGLVVGVVVVVRDIDPASMSSPRSITGVLGGGTFVTLAFFRLRSLSFELSLLLCFDSFKGRFP